jgi:hypothetical protein
MNTTLTPVPTHNPEVVAAFRTIRVLLGAYLLAGIATLAVVVVLRGHAGIVNTAVWTRTVIVGITAVVLYAAGSRAARGSRGAYRRLCIISAITVLAIAIIVVVPGPFPTWLRIEQAAGGLVMLRIAVLANNRILRAVFA